MLRRHKLLLQSATSTTSSFVKGASTRPLFPTSAAVRAPPPGAPPRRPKFLDTLDENKAMRHVCFQLPSLLTVDELLSEIAKFQREAEDKVRSTSPLQMELARQKLSRDSLAASAPPPESIDYVGAARCLAASITPGLVRSFLRERKAFDPTKEREALVPFALARQLILEHLPAGATLRDFFDRHDLQYVEYDRFAQPQLFTPNSGSPYTDTGNEAVPRRVPCCVIMGHIDHGKTTLLDTLQSSNIVATEPGLITQSIRAFTVQVAAPTAPTGKMLVTFIDTPGHRIFAEIRLNTSRIADVVLLLISLDEGVKGQTEEVVRTAIQYEKPLVVVLSKVDLFTSASSASGQLLAKRIEQIQGDLAALGVKVHFLPADAARSESAIRSAVEALRSKWYRFDGKTVNMSEIRTDPDTGQPLNDAAAAPGRVLRAAVGLCVSAKFGYNIDVLMQLLQCITSHPTFPRASPAVSPTQCRVLESFRDYDADRAARKQHRARSNAIPNVALNPSVFNSAHRNEAPVNIVAIVRNGALRVGMPFVADMGWGVVERVQNTWGDTLLSSSSSSSSSSTDGVGNGAEPHHFLRPGAAVVITGSQDTTCPAPGTHLIQVRTAAEAELVSKFRNRLRFFIERHPDLVHLLRPDDHRRSKFLHIGNYGQAEMDSNFDYRLLYKDAKPPEVRESATEAQWRANQLPPEQQPRTADEYSEYVKRCRVLHVLVKVDNWNSVRVASREIPRLATKDVLLNIVGAGFGPVTEQDLQKFGGNLHMIVAFRSPRLQNPHIEFALRGRGVLYGEFDVYTDMIEWIKGHVLRLQAEESEKRAVADDKAARESQTNMLRAAGFEKGDTRQKPRTTQQLTPTAKR